MKRSVKLLALLLAGALALSGCRLSTPSTVLSVQGQALPAGVYLMLQMQAFSTAGTMVESGEDVLKATIEEQTGMDWVHGETLRLVRRYAYLEQEFAAQSLSFNEEETDSMKKQVDTNWPTAQKTMERNGVGAESYRMVYENEMKYEKLFSSFVETYGETVSDADAKAYMDEIYSHVTTFSLPVTTNDGETVDEATSEKISKLAQEMADKLNQGEAMDELAPDYLEQAMKLCEREYSEDLLTQYQSTSFVSEDYAYFPEDLLEQVLQAKVGEAGVYPINKTPYVYQKIENYKDDADFMNYRDTLVNGMAVEKFDAQIDADSAAYEVVEDADAVRAYSPKKIKLG